MDTSKAENSAAVRVLRWLADSPLFIDQAYIEAFYDAVIRPEATVDKTTISTSRTGSTEKAASAKLGVEAGLPQILQTLVPGLGLKVTGELGGGTTKKEEQAEGVTLELHEVDNPHRQLIHLVVHYLVNLPDRFVLYDGTDRSWIKDEFAVSLPRALVFMDLPSEIKFVPTAAELKNGRVVTFYDQLALKLATAGKPSPLDYPTSKPGTEEEVLKGQRKEYWKWFSTNYQPEKANRIVEEVIGDGGPIAWINYRMALDGEGTTLHLSLAGRNKYDTGAFAYDFVQRGFRHGLRIVGALRSEPSLRVLAVFEK